MSFDLQPDLKGEFIELRPLTPGDWKDLYAVASDPLIWEQHPESDRYKEEVFKVFFREALESGGAFVVIGWTFLTRKYWGGHYNREMKKLMLAHAFKFVENVVFFVGETNFRSQKAMEKIGAIRSGIVTRAYGNHPPALNVKYVIKKS